MSATVWLQAVTNTNKTGEDTRKFIVPKEPEASSLRWTFYELAHGTLAADQKRKEANKKGLKCSRSNFWTAVRNPVYCGKIFIPKFKDDESHLVQGQHQPLISETLFYKVLDVLNGKKRKERSNTKFVSQVNLPLRGYLSCPKCNRMLTGSASKGQYGLYYYYHCVSSCGCRYRANHVNDTFVKELKKFKPHSSVIELYKIIICNAYKKLSAQQQNGSKQLVEEMNKINERLNKARQLLLSEDIDTIDYRSIKSECEDKLMRLEAKLAETATNSSTSIGIDKLINKAVSTLSHLDIIYSEGNITMKREIISSICPEKLSFDGIQYRTPRINEAVRLIYRINNELSTNKKPHRIRCFAPFRYGSPYRTILEPFSGGSKADGQLGGLKILVLKVYSKGIIFNCVID